MGVVAANDGRARRWACAGRTWTWSSSWFGKPLTRPELDGWWQVFSLDVRVAVVGGGIGGLAAAAFLGRAGIEVTLFEQARALTEVGAGLVVTPPDSAAPATVSRS